MISSLRFISLLLPVSLLAGAGPVTETGAPPVCRVEADGSARACCRVCTTGKACGNSCISRSYTCRRGPGCACDAAPIRATPAPAAASDAVREAQRLLGRLGYDAGPADGRMGERTRTAIRRFQADQGLSVDGTAGPRTLERLRQVASSRR